MAEAARPENEQERLDALHSYDLVDREVSPIFDTIIRIAADVCDVEISVIALIDDDRQYFLSRNNMKPTETPRAIAFCAHAILEPHSMFEIENATEDPRFKDNPLVTGEIGVRFYAACPLTTAEGLAIGGLCLIGKQPKSLNETQRATLKNLANVIMSLFEARKVDAEIARELHEAKKVADAENTAKTNFLSIMSHELRTPLNAVIGYSDILQSELFGPLGHENYREYVDAIKVSGDHLYNLIGEILDISRIDMGELELDDTRIDVTEAVNECLTIVQDQADRGEVDLVVGVDPEFPALLGDELRFRQIILNILSNAIKFTPKRGRVSVDMNMADDRGLVLVVSDNGCGIAPEQMDRVMEPFGQVREDPKLYQKGTGLGLPLSRGLVELHGGTLALESKPDVGTTVTATFPARRTIARAR